MIELNNLNYKYNDKIALKKINLEIKPNEVTVIVGKNGSGKSTLANVISGILKVKNNMILIDNIEINKLKMLELRKKVGIVFQNPNNQIVFPKIYDDIKFTLENLKFNKTEIDERIKSSLKQVGMNNFINNNPYELSFGEKQRVAIANVLAIKPEYIIFDEVTSMLDSEGKNKIYRIIKELKRDGLGIVFITNNIDEILLGDKIIFLEKGSIYKDINKANKKELISTLEKLNFDFTFYYKVLKDALKNNLNAKEIIDNEKYFI